MYTYIYINTHMIHQYIYHKCRTQLYVHYTYTLHVHSTQIRYTNKHLAFFILTLEPGFLWATVNLILVLHNIPRLFLLHMRLPQLALHLYKLAYMYLYKLAYMYLRVEIRVYILSCVYNT